MNDQPRKYVKKPVQVEAMRLTASNIQAVANWINNNGGKATNANSLDYLRIHTLEGVMNADLGDHIIKGIEGEFYLCKPDIFKKVYKRAVESDRAKTASTILEDLLAKISIVPLECVNNDKERCAGYNDAMNQMKEYIEFELARSREAQS